jgi:hypothetical protein
LNPRGFRLDFDGILRERGAGEEDERQTEVFGGKSKEQWTHETIGDFPVLLDGVERVGVGIDV